MKNIRISILKTFKFSVMRFSIYLKRRVFVMYSIFIIILLLTAFQKVVLYQAIYTEEVNFLISKFLSC